MLPLVLENVSFAVDGKAIIDRVSVEIVAGPRTVILGPNGAGKSVLMRLCHGLLKPTAGVIAWRGPANRLRQAMVFQRPVMLRRSAYANVDYALKVAGVQATERKRLATEALDEVGLRKVAQHPARVLSGGGSSASHWRAPGRSGRKCCSSTSPPPISIPAPPAMSRASSARSAPAAPRS